MIDRTTIDRLMTTADIVEVVGEFVNLRRSGANFKGLCPFHDEKTPSFMVSPARQICKCFSCGKGGNVVHFLMEHEQMTYPEALRWLGRKYGIEVRDKEQTDEERREQSERESMYALNAWAAEYFQRLLHETTDGVAIGKAYFRQRGFRDDIIRKFALGYALPAFDALSREALAAGYDETYLVRTGLCYKTERGTLGDRFHGRVIFPVHTVSGRVVAFGGRILTADKTKAKYVNSPESDIYSKSRELYGLYQAKQAIIKADRCYLVEGYTDVISMHQSGIENVVASSGTSLTEGQIRLVHRFTNHITVLYDGDAAGIRASLRGIDMLLAEGLDVKVLLLPDGDDPDSFARKHTAAEYRDYMDRHQTDFITFKTELLMQEASGDPVRRAELIQSIIRSVSVVPDRVVRQMYIAQCARMMNVSEQLVESEIAKARRAAKSGAAAARGGLSARHAEAVGPDAPTSRPIAADQASESRPQSAGPDAPTPADAPPSGEASASARTSAALLAGKPAHAEEEELVRLVVRYGERPMPPASEDDEAPVSVAEYIAGDLCADEIEMSLPLHRRILEECLAHTAETGWEAATYFTLHPDPEISALAVRLSAGIHVLSRHHEAQYVPEEQRLGDVVDHLLLDYKYAILRRRKRELLDALRDPATAADKERAADVMRRFARLTEIEKKLAGLLGERVLSV